MRIDKPGRTSVHFNAADHARFENCTRSRSSVLD